MSNVISVTGDLDLVRQRLISIDDQFQPPHSGAFYPTTSHPTRIYRFAAVRSWISVRLATAVVVALFLVAGGAYLWSAGDEYREPVAVPTPIGTSSAADVLLVHVAGAVVNPGLVRLRPGARVADAVESAGGATSTADLTTINLARPVADGEQVLVPQLGENLTADAGLTNLNSASAEQLEDLPGVGPVLAKRIVQGRPYGSVADLDQISGVGPALMSQLRDLVTV